MTEFRVFLRNKNAFTQLWPERRRNKNGDHLIKLSYRAVLRWRFAQIIENISVGRYAKVKEKGERIVRNGWRKISNPMVSMGTGHSVFANTQLQWPATVTIRAIWAPYAGDNLNVSPGTFDSARFFIGPPVCSCPTFLSLAMLLLLPADVSAYCCVYTAAESSSRGTNFSVTFPPVRQTETQREREQRLQARSLHRGSTEKLLCSSENRFRGRSAPGYAGQIIDTLDESNTWNDPLCAPAEWLELKRNRWSESLNEVVCGGAAANRDIDITLPAIILQKMTQD